MFDLFGNIEQHQKELQQKLSGITVEHQSDDGAVRVTMDGNRNIRDISIDPAQFEPMDWDKLEDLILVTINEASSLAEAKAAEETKRLMNDLLPGGLGNLFGG